MSNEIWTFMAVRVLNQAGATAPVGIDDAE